MRSALHARYFLLLVVCGALAVGAACTSDPTSEDVAVSDGGIEADARRKPPVEPDDAADAAITGPMLLSETGLYSDFASRTVSSDLFAFAPRYEFWADGAQKSRWLYLPPGAKIDTTEIDHFTFPVGTKAFKEFRYEGKLIETRLLMKVKDGVGNGSWWQASYVWKEDGTDAIASPLGVTGALGTTHDVPRQVDCHNCHGDVRDVLIGVSAIQLSGPPGNPLSQLDVAGKLTTSPPATIEAPGTGIVKDALTYLHANCGHCHNSEAKRLDTQTKLRLRLFVGQSTVEETGAYTTTVGTVMRHPLPEGVTDVLVNGNPDQSGLWRRMARRDYYGMPPTGTQVVDDAGLDTIRQWIVGLP